MYINHKRVFNKFLQFVELWKIKLMCSWIFSASLMARIHSPLAAGLERLVYKNLQGKVSSKQQLPSRSTIPANSPTFCYSLAFCESHPQNGTKTCHNLSPEGFLLKEYMGNCPFPYFEADLKNTKIAFL